MFATLVRGGWLLRAIEVEMPDGLHFVEYDGRGLGYEQVTVDGLTLRDRDSWFVPRFDFKMGGRPAVVEVRVWPWLTLRSLLLRVGEQVIYAEGVNARGKGPWGPSSHWDDPA